MAYFYTIYLPTFSNKLKYSFWSIIRFYYLIIADAAESTLALTAASIAASTSTSTSTVSQNLSKWVQKIREITLHKKLVKFNFTRFFWGTYMTHINWYAIFFFICRALWPQRRPPLPVCQNWQVFRLVKNHRNHQ